MGVQKSPLQKTYEISVGSDSINVGFFGSNRQFDWIEMSLVYDKSNKHLTIYDSYNVELAAKSIKFVALENFTKAYSLINEQKKYDVQQSHSKTYALQTICRLELQRMLNCATDGLYK